MKPPIKIDDRVMTAGQPTEAELAQLHAQGVRTVINLRRPGEQNQPLDPAAEADVARNAGLAYVHIPVDSKNLSADQIDAVAQAMAASPGPVLVHWAAGGRAVLHVLLARAKAEGWSADQVLAEAERIGAPITDEGFKAFIRDVAKA